MYKNCLVAILSFVVAQTALGDELSSRAHKLDQFNAVKAVVEEYARASAHNDAESLRSIYHKDAVMYGYRYGELVRGTPEIYIQDLIKRKPPVETGDGEAFRGTADVLRIDGDIASAVVQYANFWCSAGTNHLQLVKEGGEWKVNAMMFWFREMPTPTVKGKDCY